MTRFFTLEELEKRWNIPYEILFKMLYGYETGVLKGTDIFARISLPYFGKEIKGQLNFKNTKESKFDWFGFSPEYKGYRKIESYTNFSVVGRYG